MTFGENLKALRKARGLTQEEFAKQSGISRSAIGMYESGKREPKNFEMLETIADFFNVDMNTLLGTSDAPAPAAEPMGLTARDERDIERFDPVKAIFDDSDVRSLARDRLKGVSKEEIALKKQQLKAMVAAMWMKEENEK